MNGKICLYWGERKESTDGLTQLINETCKSLGNTEEYFRFWYPTEKPKKNQTVEPVNVSVDRIKDLVFRSRSVNDIGLIEEDLGYTVCLKSNINYSIANVLSISAGINSPEFLNSVILEFKNFEELLNKLRGLFVELVEIWAPDFGFVTDELTEAELEKLFGEENNLGIYAYSAVPIEERAKPFFITTKNKKGYFLELKK